MCALGIPMMNIWFFISFFLTLSEGYILEVVNIVDIIQWSRVVNSILRMVQVLRIQCYIYRWRECCSEHYLKNFCVLFLSSDDSDLFSILRNRFSSLVFNELYHTLILVLSMPGPLTIRVSGLRCTYLTPQNGLMGHLGLLHLYQRRSH
jgi:hypothetical protein